MNRENLQKLADYLRGPAIAMQFDMSLYCSVDGEDKEPAQWKCGTVGCALGHAPACGIRPRGKETWQDYAGRSFDLDEDEWSWCFSGSWQPVDNTPQGAGDRIQWLLDHGLPKDADDQKWGDAPLCYRTVTP